jgi:hypothetical protein
MSNSSNNNYFNEKSTTRFDFGVYRNHTSKKAGSNMLTISTRPTLEQQYSVGTTTISMSIREAQALQNFLNVSLNTDTGSSTDI